MELETVQVAARHFVRLPIDRQQRGATAKSTDRGWKLPYSRKLRDGPGNNNNSTSRRSRGGCDRPAIARDNVDGTKQTVWSWQTKDNMFLSAMWLFTWYDVCSVVIFLFSSFYKLVLVIMPVTKGHKNSPLKMGAIWTRKPDEWGASFELFMDHLGPWFKIVLVYCDALIMYVWLP